MHEDAVRSLPPEAFKRGIKPLARSAKAQHCVILGFDCEYDSTTQEIVCYQLSDGTHKELREATEDMDWPTLADWVRSCLVKWGYKLRDCVTTLLVSHFSTAELSHIVEFWKNATVRRVSPQQVYNASYRVNQHMLLSVVDMYHFFNAPLRVVCETFGEGKLDYDTAHVSRESFKDPKFREYALWDAVVCARVFHKFRERVWGDYGIDIVKYPTPASTAMAIYRKHFVQQESPAPIGAVRKQAWRSLWGGRAEAYASGDFDGDYTLRDVKSLYPASVQHLGSLPLAEHWIQREEPVTWRGLCRVGFRFPEGTAYPCLPVYHDHRLLFPLIGVSDCTLAEVKAAVEIGAEIKWGKIYEYDEGDSSLNDYMNHFIRKKDEAERTGDEVGRWVAKLFMNALIGKFSQHKGDVDIEDVKQFCEKHGLPLEVALDPRFYHPEKPQAKPRIGGTIMPEWSALILGHARATMARLLAPVDSLLCSTDSMLVPASQNLAVDHMMVCTQTYLSNKNENKGQCAACPKHMPTARVRIVRNRAYAALCPHGKPVFGATHAIHLPRRHKDDKHRDPAVEFLMSDESGYKKTQHLGLKTAIRTKRRFFDGEETDMVFSRQWDNKRRLLPDGSSRPWRSAREYDRHVSRLK